MECVKLRKPEGEFTELTEKVEVDDIYIWPIVVPSSVKDAVTPLQRNLTWRPRLECVIR